MDFHDLAKQRRACHHFLPNKKIPRSDIEKMIEIATLAPSGYNAQPWEFIVINSAEGIKKMEKLTLDQPHVKDASTIIIALADTVIGRNVDALLQDWVTYGYCTEEEVPVYKNKIAKKRHPKNMKTMALRNSMLACMTLIYAAEDMGYATCPMMGIQQRNIEAEFNIPEDRFIALVIAIGHKNDTEELPRLPRKTPENLIHWETFKEKLT